METKSVLGIVFIEFFADSLLAIATRRLYSFAVLFAGRAHFNVRRDKWGRAAVGDEQGDLGKEYVISLAIHLYMSIDLSMHSKTYITLHLSMQMISIASMRVRKTFSISMKPKKHAEQIACLPIGDIHTYSELVEVAVDEYIKNHSSTK